MPLRSSALRKPSYRSLTTSSKASVALFGEPLTVLQNRVGDVHHQSGRAFALGSSNRISLNPSSASSRRVSTYGVSTASR